MKKGIISLLVALLVIIGKANAQEILQIATLSDSVETCAAPERLHGEYTLNEDNTYGATLIWPYIEGLISDWLYYDNNNMVSAFGASELWWGIMFPAESLTAYEGCSLTKVSFHEYEEQGVGTYTVRIYYGGSDGPGTLVYTEDFLSTGSPIWNTVTLSTALPIDVTQNLWITMYQRSLTYPATVCQSTGDPNGSWITLDGGSTWEDVNNYGFKDYAWMLRGFVTNDAKGETVELRTSKSNSKPANFKNRTSELDHYNIYRGTNQDNYQLINTAPATATSYYDDLTGNPGTYFYQVTAVYIDGEEECESEPASSFDIPDADYVMVSTGLGVSENSVATLYPNPTNGMLNINGSEAGYSYVIYNGMGQEVLNGTAQGSHQVNLSSLTKGLYFIRLTSGMQTNIQKVVVE